MMHFRRIILLIVAFGVLWSFNTSAISGFLSNSAEDFDFSQNTEEEEDDLESKDLKFLSDSFDHFHLLQFSFNYHKSDSQSLLQNFSPIPTTPPDC